MFVDNEIDFWKLINSEQYEVTDVNFPNEELAQIQYRDSNEFVQAGIHTNVVIAAFTTSHARVILWRELNKLNDRVLYFDTVILKT